MRLNSCTGGPGSRDPGQFVCRGLTLKTLIEIAYRKQPADVNGPGWIDSERYDVVAKPPTGATQDQIPPMLQNLLMTRFALTVRHETKTLSVYALLAPHGSARLKPSPTTGEPEDPAAAAARGRAAGQRRLAWGRGVSIVHIDDPRMSMADLATVLSARLDRPVRDLTRLDKTFAIELDFAADPGPAAAGDAPRPPTAQEALDQLGLRLEARKTEVDILVVQDALKKPRADQ